MEDLVTHLSIPARDGFELAATLYPSKTPANGTVVICSAMATSRSLYKDYALHLSQIGHQVITFDYRGTGESRPESLRGFSAKMRDWAELDMAGVVDWITSQEHPGNLILVGHSVGGQLAGLLDNSNRVDAMVTLSAQSGYWGLHPGFEKYRVWFFGRIVFPVLSHSIGYLPWSRFRSGEDLPKGVALEWARWSRSPDYLYGDPSLDSRKNFKDFTAPILAFSFSDDIWGSRRSVDNMMSRYTEANVERVHKTPADVGGQRIGHLGFFLNRGLGLWSEIDAWLRIIH